MRQDYVLRKKGIDRGNEDCCTGGRQLSYLYCRLAQWDAPRRTATYLFIIIHKIVVEKEMKAHVVKLVLFVYLLCKINIGYDPAGFIH
jgi:hypothetical protein